jgi:hypothetical protein
MKYVKLKDFTGTLNEGEILLMSKKEFDDWGKDITGVPTCITLNGDEPEVFYDIDDENLKQWINENN